MLLPALIFAGFTLPNNMQKIPELVIVYGEDQNSSETSIFTDRMKIGMMICAGNIIFSILIGLLIDHFSYKIATIANVCMLGVSTGITMLHLAQLVRSETFSALISCLWGCVDGGINVQVEILCGFYFLNDGRSFCIYFSISSVIFIIVSIVQSLFHSE